jgi:uncharacterized protein YjcR
MWHMSGRKEIYKTFWWGSMKEKDCLEDLHMDGMIILKWILRNRNCQLLK